MAEREQPPPPPPEMTAHYNASAEQLLAVARTLEAEPTLVGVSAHLLAVAHKGDSGDS